MDAWHGPEVWITRDESSFSLNWARFGINGLASGLILLQTIHILWISALEGRSAQKAEKPFSVPFNFTFPVLFLLVTQHAALACAAWFTATPMPDPKIFYTWLDWTLGLGFWSSAWLPLALAETTILLHEIPNLGRSHCRSNWLAATAFASTTLVSSSLMIAAMGGKHVRVANTYDFFSTVVRLFATFYIFTPLLELRTRMPIHLRIKRFLWLLKILPELWGVKLLLVLWQVTLLFDHPFYSDFNTKPWWDWDRSWYRRRLAKSISQAVISGMTARFLVRGIQRVHQLKERAPHPVRLAGISGTLLPLIYVHISDSQSLVS